MTARYTFSPDWPRLKDRPLTYSPAVKKGNMLFLSGITAVDPVTGKVIKGDLEAQTRMVFQNIKDILEAAGATLDDVVKTTDYITPAALPSYKVTADVRREFFKDNFPAATGVIIHSLIRPDMLIEIDAVAVLD